MKILILFVVLCLCFFYLLVTATSLGVFVSLLLTVLFYVLLHGLFLLVFDLIARRTPNDRPIEKQDPVCVKAVGEMINLVNRYFAVDPVITGTELFPTDTPFVYICNHRSMFDPLVVMDRLREYNISFISKPSNMNFPCIGRIAYACGFLPIDRENNRNALKTILTAADYLKKGICNIGIYPEGTRSKTRDLLPFHAGSFKIAQKAGVPIVVASIHGTENIRHMRLFRKNTVYLNILAVIPAEEVCATRTDALSERVRGMIEEDLRKAEGSSGAGGAEACACIQEDTP